MTTLDDDESLERDLFARRERVLVAETVPRLEDVLRGAHGADAANDVRLAQITPAMPAPRDAEVVPFTRRPRPSPRLTRAVLLVAACAAAIAAAGPRLRDLVAPAPEATIVPEPAPRVEPAWKPAAAPPPEVTSSSPPPSACVDENAEGTSSCQTSCDSAEP